MLISNFALEYFNFEICIDKSQIKFCLIKGFNFCYNKYTNINKIIWVGSANDKYLYWKYYIYLCQYHKNNNYISYKVNKMIVLFIYQKHDCK